MPVPWTQAFDFYIIEVEDLPVLVRVDMAAIEHIPIASHGVGMKVSVPMQRPRDDGLRSVEESEVLFEIQADIVKSLEIEQNAIYWGAYVGHGTTDFLFYVEREIESIEDRLSPFLAVRGYSSGVKFVGDPTWSLYRNAYPNAYFKQTMLNRQTQIQLEEQGDRLTKRRRVEHFCLFESEESAKRAATELKKRRFKTGRVQAPDPSGYWTLPFHRTDACDGHTPDYITDEILTVVQPLGGAYDGWGCKVAQ